MSKFSAGELPHVEVARYDLFAVVGTSYPPTILPRRLLDA